MAHAHMKGPDPARGLQENWLLHKAMPWLIAFFYYHVSWICSWEASRISYRLNAEFEDHAEHEYNDVRRGPSGVRDGMPEPGT